MQDKQSLLCVVFSDGTIYFYNAEEKQLHDRVVQAQQEGKDACLLVNQQKVLMTDILLKMAETDNHSFENEYESSKGSTPKIDLDRDPLVLLHKNVYVDLGCLKKFE